MDQELYERVGRRCVGHEDDPIALTKGEVRQLMDWFNKDREGMSARLGECEQAYQGASICDEKHLKEAAERIRNLEWDLLVAQGHAKEAEEKAAYLQHCGETNAKMTKELEQNGTLIAVLRAQLKSANKFLQDEREKVQTLTTQRDFFDDRLKKVEAYLNAALKVVTK